MGNAFSSPVPTKNPRREDYDFSLSEPDAATWRRVALEVRKTTGSIVDIEVLRPHDWIDTYGLEVGGTIDFYLDELELDGVARVLAIDPCPPIASGEGEVITGRFTTRRVDHTVKITLDSGETLEGTTIHPIWSPQEHDWVPLGEFEIGDTVLTRNGIESVQAVESCNQTVPVYNFEVRGEHVYEVTTSGILVHNAYGVAPNTPPLANVLEGHSAQQGFTGVIDSSTGKVLIRPSTAASEVPAGWVARRGGHADVSSALGGNAASHRGFAVILQEDGSLAVTWRSGVLNSPPDYVVPREMRQSIVNAIEAATGRKVSSF